MAKRYRKIFPKWAQKEDPSSPLGRRGFLKGTAALAAGAAGSLFANKLSWAQQQLADPQPIPDDEEVLDIQYDLNNFDDIDVSDVEPISTEQDTEITVADFTRGMSCVITSMSKLDAGLKFQLVDTLSQVESSVFLGDVESANNSLLDFRDLVIRNADTIDAAAGVFAFGEVTSFTQSIIVLVDFLLTLKVRLIGIIFVFPVGLIIKIIEVFQQYTVCLTVIQITVFTIYLRFFLFILVIRFKFFPGLRICIDILILFISICLRVVIVQVFLICVTITRRLLLLVSC